VGFGDLTSNKPGKWRVAEEALQGGRAKSMQTHITDPVEFNNLLERAYSDFKEGNFDAAEPALKNALPSLSHDREASAQCLDKLIEMSSARSDYGEAIRQSLCLLSILKSKHGEFDQNVLIRMYKLARIYESAGRLDEAEYMHTRMSVLKNYLVQAKLTDEQKAIAAKKEPEEQKEDILGPEPEWLEKAFKDANQIYGTGTVVEPENAALAIEVPDDLTTGHYFRPTKPQVKEGSKLRDITDFGQRVEKPTENLPAPPPQPKARVSNLRVPPPENKPSSIVPIPLSDEISYLEVDVSSARLKKLEEVHTPSERHWSFLQKLVEHSLKAKPLPELRKEEEPPPGNPAGKRPDKEPTRTEVRGDKLSRKEKTAGKPADLPADGEDVPTEFKDLIWSVGKIFTSFGQAGAKFATIGDIIKERINSDPRHLTRKVPSKSVMRKSREMSLPPAQESLLMRDAIHKVVHLLDKLKQKDNLIQAILTTIVICLALLILADRFIPRKVVAAEVFAQMPVAYKAAAGDMQLRLIDPTSAQLSWDETNVRVPCNMFLGDWRDCLNISFSALIQKQHWLLRTEEGLKSDEGPLLYYTGGPELQIADHMEDLANICAGIYSSTGAYPISLSDFPRGRLAYVNPFSKETVRPVIKRLYFDTDKDPLQRVHALMVGADLPDETNITPGTITFYSVTIQAPEQHMFFVRGYDRFAKQLAGSGTTGTNFFLAQKDGHWIRSDSASSTFTHWTPRKHTLWLIDGTTDNITLFILSQGGAYFFAAMCILVVLLKQAVKPVKATKRILDFLIPASAALSVLYAFARFLP
jgi:tetratricopeptide (TPR) repeat protein